MKKVKRTINHWIKNGKRMIEKNKENSIIALCSVIAIILFWLTVGLVRAIIFVAIIDLLVFGILFLKRTKMSKGRKKKLMKKILIIVFSIGIFLLAAAIAFIGYIVITAPKFDANKLDRNEASVIYDSKGAIIAKLGTEKREKITYDQMPDVLVDAIVATEDSRFFQHNGFDLPRFAKATFGQLIGQSSGGASTITMQVSKNNYTSTIATGLEGIVRKFTDIYISIFQIEKKYTKQEIMEFYVNQPYLGSGTYGVEQACQTYFGKSAKDINLSEAAIIAGLFQAPNSYDPYTNPELTTKRRAQVLYLMKLHGYISAAEQKAANDITVVSLLSSSTDVVRKYQAFVDTVVEDVVALTGKDPYVDSLEIFSTMDKDKQAYIDDIMSGETFKWENDLVDAGISVIDAKTGAIVAVGAGRNNTGQRQFNHATMIKRQIGSTAKPFYDYGPEIEYNNWSTYTPIVDEPHSYTGGLSIDNWDMKFQGLLTLRKAFSQSRNIPALKAFQANQNRNIKAFVLGLGLSPEGADGPLHESHALGGYNGESPLSMSAAFAAFGNGGYYTKPYSFTKTIDRKTGEVFETPIKKERAMSAATAYMVSSVLVDAAKWGLYGQYPLAGVNYGAKTGTTNFDEATFKNFNLSRSAINDAWIDGVSADYAISLWYGYDKINNKYFSTLGNIQPRLLFRKIAQGVFIAGTNFTKPSDVISVSVELESYPAMLPSANTPSKMIVTELFKKGTEPTEVSSRYNTLPNATNLISSVAGAKVTLTWGAIKTPSAYDTATLDTYFNTLYSNTTWRTNAYNNRINYNNNNIGAVGYNVYQKNSDNSLTLLGFTTSNTYEATPVGAGTSADYVVKSTFSIFQASQSSGVSINVPLSNIGSVFTVSMNGDNPYNIALNGTYTEQSVTGQVNGVNVVLPSGAIKKTIKKGTVVIGSVDTTTAGIYTVTYDVKYNSYDTITLIRTVNVN